VSTQAIAPAAAPLPRPEEVEGPEEREKVRGKAKQAKPSTAKDRPVHTSP